LRKESWNIKENRERSMAQHFHTPCQDDGGLRGWGFRQVHRQCRGAIKYRPKLHVTYEEGGGDNGDEDDFCTLEYDDEDTMIVYTGLRRRVIMRWQRRLFADWQGRPPHKLSEDRPNTGGGAL
jgi:hypothetical protein